MNAKELFWFLVTAGWLVSGCAGQPASTPDGGFVPPPGQLFLTTEDLSRLRQEVGSGNQKSVSDRGYWVHCLPGSCRVSCQPRQAGTEKDPLGRESQCWVTLKPVNLDAYLKLVEEARSQGGRRTDPPGIADCDATGCLIRTGM